MRNGATDDLVERLKELDEAVFEEDAWQLELDAFGIEKNMVFLRSDGTSLYTTRDLAHHEWKLETFDEAVTVLGEDHKLQANRSSTPRSTCWATTPTASDRSTTPGSTSPRAA